jgi:hypothetical protein
VIIKTCQNKNTTMEFSKMQDSSTKKCWNLLNIPVTSLHHVKWRTQNFSRHWDASGRTNEAPRRCVLNWGIPQNGNFSKDNGYSPSNFGVSYFQIFQGKPYFCSINMDEFGFAKGTSNQ